MQAAQSSRQTITIHSECHAETSTAEQGKQPYKYNGKELDQAHGLNLYDYSARYKDDWRFTTVDPMAENYFSMSPYAYCANNPIKFIDSDGRSYSSPPGAFLGIDWQSAQTNHLANTNIKENASDIQKNSALAIAANTDANDVALIATTIASNGEGGVNIDGTPASSTDTFSALAGMLIPVVSGSGVKKVIKGIAEGLGIAVDATKILAPTKNVVKKVNKTDFIVTPDGVAVPLDQKRMREGFNNAGFPNSPASQTAEPGVIHKVPTRNGPVDVRTMEGSAHHPKRAVITHPGTNTPKTPNGRATNNKKDNHIEQH